MLKKLVFLLALPMALAGCSDSDLLSTSGGNNNDLFDFSMVPSGYQKSASSEDLDNVGAMATMMKTLDQRVLRSKIMPNVDDLARLQKNISPYNSLDQELNQELSLCTVDTMTDRVGNITMIGYGFMPDTRCPFSLSGSYKQASGAIHPPSVDSPSVETVNETFTLTALPGYTGEIASITLSMKSRDLRQNFNERGRTNRNEKQSSISGVLTLKTGEVVNFGLKNAYGQSSKKVSDRRTQNNLRTDFRAGFEFQDSTTLYQDFYQKNHDDQKATKRVVINGIQQN